MHTIGQEAKKHRPVLENESKFESKRTPEVETDKF
jgi:hypothetical protein